MLDSHLDEVGFMVQSVSVEGKLAFVPLGGWWPHVLLGQRVDVLTEDAIVPGVIGGKPPHFLSPEERNRLLGMGWESELRLNLFPHQRQDPS